MRLKISEIELAVRAMTDKTSTTFFFVLENSGGRIYGLTHRKLCGLIDVTILDFL
jgi:hypothetical protein